MKNIILIIMILLLSMSLFSQGFLSQYTGQEIETILDYSNGVTAGTAQPSKALILDASKNIAGINNITIIGDINIPNDIFITAIKYAGGGNYDLIKLNQDDNIEFGRPVDIGELFIPLAAGVATLVDIDADGASAGTKHGITIMANATDTLFSVITEDDGASGINNTLLKMHGDVIITDSLWVPIICVDTLYGMSPIVIMDDTSVLGKLSATTYGSDGTVTDAELLHINTLSSNAQTQIAYVAEVAEAALPKAGGTMTGRIVSSVAACSSGSDDFDVEEKNVITVDLTGTSVVLGGLRHGSAGQVIDIVVIVPHAENVCTIEHNEGTGTQKFFLNKGVDEANNANKYTGWRFYCNGTNWYQIGFAENR